MAKIVLKPCPFCGEKYALEIKCKQKKHKKYPYRVQCDSCFTRGDWFASKRVAADEWNRRVNDA